MTDTTGFIDREALEFQGRVTASVSHKINNVLATISETAALLSDLTELADSGRPADPARLRSCAGTISGQVKRGFGVVKALNRFAHSADEPVAEVDLGDLVALMVELAGYLSYASTVDLQRPEDDAPRLRTRPLVLEDLVYRALVHAFKDVGAEGTVTVAVQSTTEHDGLVVIGGLDAGATGDFVDDSVSRLADVVGGRVEVDPARGQIRIMVQSPAAEP